MTDDEGTEISEICNDIGLPDVAGIPLPPQVQRSLWKALGKLIIGLADVPAAYLEAKSRAIRTNSEGEATVSLAAAQAAAQQFGKKPELADRAVGHFAAKIVHEQVNRESVARIAIEDLQADGATQDADSEVDEDWLALFSDIASKKSNADLQLLLGKILAGEIRKPGSFSPATIQVLSTLTQDIAQRFQALCELSFSAPMGFTFIITDPLPKFAQSGSDELGISYHDLVRLQSAGLLPPSLSNTLELAAYVNQVILNHNGKNVAFVPDGKEEPKLGKTAIVLFSSVGHELRQIVSVSGNPWYEAKLQQWMEGKSVLIRPAKYA